MNDLIDKLNTMLKELKQNEEKLYTDYCDAIARLKAINKIVESNQTLRQKIDGIKPLTEMGDTIANGFCYDAEREEETEVGRTLPKEYCYCFGRTLPKEYCY